MDSLRGSLSPAWAATGTYMRHAPLLIADEEVLEIVAAHEPLEFGFVGC